MSLVACKECGNEMSTRALACPHCGARRSRQVHPVFAALGLIIGVPLVAMVVAYGTVRPCSALRETVVQRVMRESTPPSPGEGPLAVAGDAIGVAFVRTAADSFVARLSTPDCIRALIDIHTRGRLSEGLAAKANPR